MRFFTILLLLLFATACREPLENSTPDNNPESTQKRTQDSNTTNDQQSESNTQNDNQQNAGSGEQPNTPPTDDTSQLYTINNVDITVSTALLDSFDQDSLSFSQGENLTFRITLNNDNPFPWQTTYTAPGYSIVVYPENSGTAVWQSHYGLAFAQVISNYSIDANSTDIIDHAWDLTDNNGNSLPVGNYLVQFHTNIGGIGDLGGVSFSIQ